MLDDTITHKIEHYCAYQERCHEDVRSKLLELRCPPEDIDELISHLIEHNYLNEMRYAEQYVLGKFRMKKWGRKKIVYNLKLKKISEYCIQKAVLKISEEEYLETLDMLIERKAQELPSSNEFHKKKKIYNYLIQKGYESDIILTHTR